jgi:hypothetical protein
VSSLRHSPSRNEKGFFLASFIVFLPLLLAIVAVGGASYLLIHGDGASRHACRSELLRVQRQVAESLQSLLALNEKARHLRLKRTQAEVACQAVAGTPAEAAAIAKLATVIAQQSALHARQLTLISQAQALTRGAGPKAQRAAMGAIDSHSHSRSAAGPAPLKMGEFHVIASPISSASPDYQPAPRFRDSQEVVVQWFVDLRNYFGPWLTPFLENSPLRFGAECSATIEPQGRTWVARLSRGRF